MNSGYIELDKILARKDIVEWLDECGVVWAASRHTFAAFTNITQPFIEYVKLWDGFVQCDEPFTDSTHCQTPEQFCELIAETLGIDKPVFGDDINVFKKPVAIQYSLLNKPEIVWLKENVGIENNGVPMQYFNCVFLGESSNQEHQIIFQNGLTLNNLGYTITESPKVFMEYVAQQTGKEYKPEIASEKEIAEMLEKMSEDCFTPPTYPHKTYRILDSLDGIPLDTRFKLSEWIPPMNSRAEVIAIASQDLAYHGYYKHLQGDCITFHSFKLNGELILPLDGEWMRIV